jgi:hypothetical protein
MSKCGLGTLGTVLLLGAAGVLAPTAHAGSATIPLCSPPDPGVNCGPGNNRRTAGGGGVGKVPHSDGLNRRSRATRFWPALSGILWQALDDADRTKLGGPLSDELLGHHGSDTLLGSSGNDIIWGDWDPVGNSTHQHDILSGGPGNDWLYPSHGRSTIRGGPGNDYIWAYYGSGTIDCGPGIDTARIRTNGAFRTKNCEHIRHFCANGENTQGQCLSPTGTPVAELAPTRNRNVIDVPSEPL